MYRFLRQPGCWFLCQVQTNPGMQILINNRFFHEMFVCMIYADICAYALFVNDTHYRKWGPMFLQVILEAQRTSLTWPFHSTQPWPWTLTVQPPAVEICFHIQTVRSNLVWGHGLTHQGEQLAHLLSKWPGFKSALCCLLLCCPPALSHTAFLYR